MGIQPLVDFVNDLNAKYLVALLLGFVVIWAFASRKYDQPSYAKTSIGNLGELSPRSLASDARYQKGFYIYLFWLLCLYVGLCVIGPKATEAFGLTIPEALKSTELWPLGLASAFAVIGALSEDKFPGSIEAFIRRKSHEAAYIPKAVQSLAADLAAFDLVQWVRNADAKTIEAIQESAFGKPEPALHAVALLTEGKLVSWVRANILLYSYKQLPKQYAQIKAQSEPKSAFRFLETLQISIKTKLDHVVTNVPGDMDEPLSKDIDQLGEGASFLLASTLLQATPEARDLSQIVAKQGFGDIDSTSPQNWQQFAVVTLGCVWFSVLVVWAALFFAREDLIVWGTKLGFPIAGLDLIKVGNLSDRVHVTAINTALTYTVIVLILMYIRERNLNNGAWEGRLSSYVSFIVWAGIPAGLITSLALVMLPTSPLQFAYNILFSTIAVALLAAGFFVRHMRAASICQDGIRPTLWTVFGPGVFLHAAIAVLIAGFLQFLMQRIDIDTAPRSSLKQVQSQFNALEKSNAFTGSRKDETINGVQKHLADISGQFARSPTLQADNQKAVMSSIGQICVTVAAGLEKRFFEEPSNYVAPCTVTAAAEKAANSSDQKALVQFGKDLQTFFNNIIQLSDADLAGKLPWLQFFISATFSLFATLVLGIALRVSRIGQLRNQLDQFDESTLSKLKERAKQYLAQQGDPMTVENWLARPNGRIKFLAPIEGIRYAPYRAPLFDSVPLTTPPGAALRVVAGKEPNAA